MWSFPPGGNGLYKPLDSGLRRNDNGGFQLSPACRGQAGRVKKTGNRRGGSRSVSAGRPLFFGAAEGGVVSPVTFEARKDDRTGE